MRRILLVLCLVVGLLGVGVPAADAQVVHDIDHCKWDTSAPNLLFGQMFNWTFVSCDRPTYVTIYTTLRRQQFIPWMPGPVVAANTKSELIMGGWASTLLTRVKCQSVIGVSQFFYGNTLIYMEYPGAPPFVASGESLSARLPCRN